MAENDRTIRQMSYEEAIVAGIVPPGPTYEETTPFSDLDNAGKAALILQQMQTNFYGGTVIWYPNGDNKIYSDERTLVKKVALLSEKKVSCKIVKAMDDNRVVTGMNLYVFFNEGTSKPEAE